MNAFETYPELAAARDAERAARGGGTSPVTPAEAFNRMSREARARMVHGMTTAELKAFAAEAEIRMDGRSCPPVLADAIADANKLGAAEGEVHAGRARAVHAAAERARKDGNAAEHGRLLAVLKAVRS